VGVVGAGVVGGVGAGAGGAGVCRYFPKMVGIL